MSLQQIVINQNNLVLPNGQVYQSGNVAIISSNFLSLISPTLFTNNNISNTTGGVYSDLYTSNYE